MPVAVAASELLAWTGERPRTHRGASELRTTGRSTAPAVRSRAGVPRGPSQTRDGRPRNATSVARTEAHIASLLLVKRHAAAPHCGGPIAYRTRRVVPPSPSPQPGPRGAAFASRTAGRSPAARRAWAALARRAREAEHAVGHRPQPCLRYWVPAGVARSVGSLVELGQRPLGAGKGVLKRAADADVGQPTDGLDRSVADPLAEPDRATSLRSRCEHCDPLARDVPTRFEFAADGVEFRIVGGGGHAPVLPNQTATTMASPSRWEMAPAQADIRWAPSPGDSAAGPRRSGT